MKALIVVLVARVVFLVLVVHVVLVVLVVLVVCAVLVDQDKEKGKQKEKDKGKQKRNTKGLIHDMILLGKACKHDCLPDNIMSIFLSHK